MFMDGLSFFAEAECVVLRICNKKTRKIHRIVVHLELFDASLDGATLAQHVTGTLVRKPAFDNNAGLGLKLCDWHTTAIDCWNNCMTAIVGVAIFILKLTRRPISRS